MPNVNVNVNDEDLMNIVLSHQKYGATALSNLVLESASDALRRDVTNILEGTFTQQKQVFDYMSQNGWYQVQAASQTDVDTAKNTIQATY